MRNLAKLVWGPRLEASYAGLRRYIATEVNSLQMHGSKRAGFLFAMEYG